MYRRSRFEHIRTMAGRIDRTSLLHLFLNRERERGGEGGGGERGQAARGQDASIFCPFFSSSSPFPRFFPLFFCLPPSRSFSTVEKCITGRAAAENGGGTCAASSSRGVELVCRVQPVRPSKNRWKNRGWRGNGKRFGRDKRRTDRRSRYPNVYYRNTVIVDSRRQPRVSSDISLSPEELAVPNRNKLKYHPLYL